MNIRKNASIKKVAEAAIRRTQLVYCDCPTGSGSNAYDPKWNHFFDLRELAEHLARFAGIKLEEGFWYMEIKIARNKELDKLEKEIEDFDFGEE